MYLQNSILLPKLTQKKPMGSHFYSVCLTWTQRGKKKNPKKLPRRCLEPNSSKTGELDFMYIISGLERETAFMKTHVPVYGEKLKPWS